MRVLSALGRFCLATAVAGALCALTAGPAAADHVQCGDVITADTTLDSDLIDCPALGLEIRADDVTLDLNRHTIAASETSQSAPYMGVRSYDNDRVTIRNGTIRGFDESGVELSGTTGTVVEDLTVEIKGLGSGIRLLRDCRDNAIRDNYIVARGPGSSSGIFVFDCFPSGGRNLVERNRIVGVQHGISLDAADDDIVRANLVLNSGANGIELYSGAERNRVEHNVILRSGSIGIAVDGGTSGTSSNNVVSGNWVAGGSQEGIAVLAYATNNVVKWNVVRRNALDGIWIQTLIAGHNVVTANASDRNGDDGIGSNDSTSTLTGNHIWFNRDFGIEALPGTLGGKNWAKHNGNPAQCTPAYLCSNKKQKR